MYYLVPKHLFASIELENLLPQGIYKPYAILLTCIEKLNVINSITGLRPW